MPGGRQTARAALGLAVALSALVLTGCGTLSLGLDGEAGLGIAASPPAPPPHRWAEGGETISGAWLAGEASPDVERLPGSNTAWSAGPVAWEGALLTDGEAQPMPSALASRGEDDSAEERSVVVEARLGEPSLLSQAPSGDATQDDLPLEPVVEEYDPWESFNETMFAFNLRLDRYVVKPIAKAWNFVLPDEIQRMIGRVIDNARSVPRIVNNVLQGKFDGAGRETARFFINSVVGLGGLWDMAKQEWGILKSDEDFGQTLGVAGSGPGPYLILPFLPPLTIRDGIGRVVDIVLDPLTWLLPTGVSIGVTATERVNDRALNLELFEGFEETTLDLYSAVRNAYLARRKRQISE